MASNGDLLVDRLEIRDFRLFEHLTVEHFGRVNLIVGSNGVGKTALLEALRIWATAGHGEDVLLRDLAEARAEFFGPSPHRISTPQRPELPGFFRRADGVNTYHIGTGRRSVQGLWKEVQHKSVISEPPVDTPNPCLYVSPHGVSSDEAGQMWDQVKLTLLEDEVVKALAMVFPKVDRIDVPVGDGTASRIAWVRLKDLGRPVPLKSLGDGASRIFGIALKLVNVKDGLLLIDEIENGIHFAVQSKLWEFLIAAAKRLNVQVFATTHSTDAIRAFQWATKQDPDSEGILTRLQMKGGKIQALQFNEDDLEIAVQDSIEVR